MKVTTKEDMSRFRSCIAKQRFDDFRAAKIHANSAQTRAGMTLRPYSCSECSGFHLTSMNRDAVAKRDQGWRTAELTGLKKRPRK